MPAKRWLAIAGLLLVILVVVSALKTDSNWEGVDAAVVGKYAGALGRQPSPPLLNLQGDLQLFVFAIAGLVGGFLLGYWWRDMFGPGRVIANENEKGSVEREVTDVSAR